MTTGAPELRRGEVWLANLDKLRPVVVLTRDPMGRHLRSLLVAPVTSTARGLSTEVAVGPDDGIRRESVLNLDNTALVDRSAFVRPVGRLHETTMRSVCRALAFAVDCA